MALSSLGVAHYFGVAISSWTSGTIELINREVVRTFRAFLSERRRPVSEWPLAVEAVQWTLILAFRERLGTTPFQMMMKRPQPTAMSVLVDAAAGEWTSGESKRIAGWVSEQEAMQSRRARPCAETAGT